MNLGNLRSIEAKDITLATILSYVIGFVITNIYLANFAFAEFSFFHIKFIPIGFLFLLLSLAVFFTFYTIDVRYAQRGWYVRVPLFLAMAAVIIFCLSIVFGNNVDAITGYNRSIVFRLDFGFWVLINLVLYFIVSSIVRTKHTTIHNFSDLEDSYRFISRIFFFIFLIIFNVGLFSNLIYPSVPTYLGGGRQIQAAIVLENASSTEPTFVRIIYQTPEYILYQSLSTSTASLRVTMVPFERITAIEYLGIDRGTGHTIFSGYLENTRTFVGSENPQ